MKRFRINPFGRKQEIEPEIETPPAADAAAPAPIDADASTGARWHPVQLFRRERRAHVALTPDTAVAESPPAESSPEAEETARPESGRRFRWPTLRRHPALETEAAHESRDAAAPPLDAPHTRRLRTRALPWRRRAAPSAEDEPAEVVERKPRLRLRRPRLHFPWRVRPGVLLLALSMFGLAGLGVALNLGVVPAAIGDLWPLALIALGAVLLPGALRPKAGGRLLAAISLAAAGMSFLLAEADLLPVGTTLATALLVAFGFTVMVRAVLLHSAE